MQNKTDTLEPDFTYHIFNRANGNERLFVEDENYRFFLDKYKHYVQPIAETFCFCLMPNHFHFLVRVREQQVLKQFFSMDRGKDLQGFENLEGLVSRQFSNLFNAYAKAFNKQEGRKGSLFMHTYKRKKVTDEKYFRKLVHYMHYNPGESGLSANLQNWKYSSYRAIISARPTDLLRGEVLDYFGDREFYPLPSIPTGYYRD